MRTAYRCRAYPDPAQQAVLNRTFGCVRKVWNDTLSARQQRYATERKARSLARYQRRLARCQKGSANRAKAKAKAARAYRKVRDARRDFVHRASTRLVRGNDVIVIEDLNVRGMVLAAGQAVTACGADVRHSGTSRVQSAVKQEPRPATAGIPVPQGGE
jgi:transposase